MARRLMATRGGTSRTVLGAALAVLLVGVSLEAEAQQCVERPNLMYCGTTQRSGSQLYSGVGPFTETQGCAPDADTQALLVTRSGTISGNGPAWLAYLNAGGRIITEYSIGRAVYNEIYGTAYPLGAWFGNCRDNAMPEVKLNPSHPFWIANDIPVTPPNDTGFGYDLANIVAGEAEVTALGGVGSAVSFAVRPQGGGLLFLLEADWQDSEPSYLDQSRQFMGALISSCPQQRSQPVPAPTLSVAALAASFLALTLLGARRLRRRGR